MMYKLKSLYSKIINLIKRAYITLPDDDHGNFHVAQLSYFGNATRSQIIYPYGINANAPKDTLVLVMNVQAQEENLVGIAYAQKERFKNLKVGEVTVGSPKTGSYVKFLENGDIEIFSNNNINLTGKNVKISGETVELEAIQDINLTSPDITITSGAYTSTFGSGGDFEINSVNFNVNAHVELGIGGAAIARVGDTVNVSGVDGTITSGGTNNST